MGVIDPEAQRAGIEKAVKIGVVALACAVSYPIAVLAFQGLIMWAAFGVGVLVISNFAPAIATWFANKKIQALVAVIEANPIETMQSLYAEKAEELKEAENSIRDFDMELGNFNTQVEEVAKEYPDDVESYIEIRDRMKEALVGMREEQRMSTEALSQFKAKIKKAQVLFNMAKAANKMLEKSASAQEQVYAEIKEAVSYNKVRSDLNRAFANLNSAVERRKTASILNSPRADRTLALPAKSSVEVIDITATEVREITPIRRVK